MKYSIIALSILGLTACGGGGGGSSAPDPEPIKDTTPISTPTPAPVIDPTVNGMYASNPINLTHGTTRNGSNGSDIHEHDMRNEVKYYYIPLSSNQRTECQLDDPSFCFEPATGRVDVPSYMPAIDYYQSYITFYQNYDHYTTEQSITLHDVNSDMMCYESDRQNEEENWYIDNEYSSTGGCDAMHLEYATGIDGKMRAHQPKDTFWGFKTNKFLPVEYDELYFSYKLTFSDNFDWARGGKLPGLGSVQPEQDMGTGGNLVTGENGFSARTRWDDNGEGQTYTYHMHSTHLHTNTPDGSYGTYGEVEPYIVSKDDNNYQFYFERGREYQIEQYVKLNDVGEMNGVLEQYINGVLVYGRYNLEFRTTYDVKINYLYLEAWHGGGDATWAPDTEDTYFYLDDVALSEQPLTFTK